MYDTNDNLSEYMDKLVATYHYSPEMRALLFKIITCMIEQYGEDKKDIF
jgi:hypothetical protein